MKRVSLNKEIQKSGLQQLAINIAGGVASNNVRYNLKNFIEVYSINVSFACYVYFNDIAGAAQLNSIFDSVTISGALTVTINAEAGNPFTLGYYNAGYFFFPEPVITKSFTLGRINSNINVVMFYKNYRPV